MIKSNAKCEQKSQTLMPLPKKSLLEEPDKEFKIYMSEMLKQSYEGIIFIKHNNLEENSSEIKER